MTVPPHSPAVPPPWTRPSPLPAQLETPRLVVRNWRLTDAAGMHGAIEASRPGLMPWLPWALSDNRTLEECIYNIERFRREQEKPTCDSYVMGIFDRTTGEPLGGTGFHRLKPEQQQAEVGYWIRGDRRRQGICTEAVRRLLSWGFTPQSEGGWGFRRVEIFCAAQNEASRGVPTKIGLRREHDAKESRWIDGVGWEDTLGWGVLAHEWDRENHAVAQ